MWIVKDPPLLFETQSVNQDFNETRPTLKNCSFPITGIAKKEVTRTAGETFFYLTQTKYYFLLQMLSSP